MRLSRRHFLAASATLPFMAATAFADEGASEYVHKLGLEVLKTVKGGHRGDKALQRRFGEMLNQYVNMPALATRALGPSSHNLPPADKAMFFELLNNYAAALFVWYVDEFQGSDLKITSTNPQGSLTQVDTVIVGTNEPLSWRVAGSGGSYRIADVKVRGVWLSIAMQKMFTDTLNQSHGDFKPLYAKLREADTW